MKLEQLELLGTLMGADKASVAYQAAKLVLVDGKRQVDVVKELNSSKNTVNNGVQRYKKAHLEVEKVYLNAK